MRSYASAGVVRGGAPAGSPPDLVRRLGWFALALALLPAPWAVAAEVPGPSETLRSNLELAADWYPRDGWRLQAAYGWLPRDLNLDLDPTGRDGVGAPLAEGTRPAHQWSLRSTLDLTRHWELDLWVAYGNRLPDPGSAVPVRDPDVSAYTSFNLRLGWRPWQDLELTLVGRNLIDEEHLELVDEGLTAPAEIERSFHAQFRLAF